MTIKLRDRVKCRDMKKNTRVTGNREFALNPKIEKSRT